MRRSEFKTLVTIGIIGAILAASIYGGYIDFTPSTVSAGDDDNNNANTTTTVVVENPYDLPDGMSIDSASYIIFKNGTLTCAKNGITGYIEFYGTDSSSVIQHALDTMSSGRMYVCEGTYTLTANISIPNNVRFTGAGTSSTIFTSTSVVRLMAYDASNITMSDIGITGKVLAYVCAISEAVNSITFQNIYASVQTFATFYIYTNAQIIRNITFINCMAYDCEGFGFYQYGTAGSIIQNERFIGCSAINCGQTRSDGNYFTGFDFNEGKFNLRDVVISDCISTGSWESGFHFESRDVHNVTLMNCISAGNGVKPASTYGSGFMVPPGATLIGCKSSNNHIGFYVMTGQVGDTGNIMLSSCVDEGSWRNFKIEGPAPTNLMTITLNGCGGYNATNVSMFVVGVRNVIINNMVIKDPVGSSTSAITIGIYGYTVKDSSFDLNVVSSSSIPDSCVYVWGGSNNTFSGSIKTASNTAININSSAVHCRIKNMDINMIGTGVGCVGINSYMNAINTTVIGTVIRMSGTGTLQYGIIGHAPNYVDVYSDVFVINSISAYTYCQYVKGAGL